MLTKWSPFSLLICPPQISKFYISSCLPHLGTARITTFGSNKLRITTHYGKFYLCFTIHTVGFCRIDLQCKRKLHLCSGRVVITIVCNFSGYFWLRSKRDVCFIAWMKSWFLKQIYLYKVWMPETRLLEKRIVYRSVLELVYIWNEL